MRLTRSQSSKAAGFVLDDGFAELREAFRSRLGSERIHLIALSAALARADCVPAQILHDLRNRSHRLSGTAAIFELATIAKAARTLELAVDAVAATPTPAPDSRARISAALDALLHLIWILGQRASSTRSSAPEGRFRRAKRTLHS